MSTPVRMPRLGESVVEGTVARWLKKPGEQVALLEPLLEISTDKIDTEIPSPAAGTLLEVLVSEGTTVATGTVLATIGEVESNAAAVEQPAIETPAQQEPEPASVEPASAETHARDSNAQEDVLQESASTDTTASKSASKTASKEERPEGRTFISPVVQRIASEHQVDLTQVQGTGLAGRITKQDILAFVEAGQSTAPSPQQQDAPPESDPAITSPPVTSLGEPLSAMRRAIAQHMVKSVQTSPHVATIFEVDMTQVVRHREANKQAFAQRGISLTYTSYFAAAVASALRKHSLVNNRYTDTGIIRNPRVHIGVAVALGEDGVDGLRVPVVRDADELTLAGLARALEDMAGRARRGGLQPDEVQGGTFTITNHGVGGSLIGTPIIVQPQSAILGVGAIVKRAIVRSSGKSLLPSSDDAIVIRPMCYLTLSFDHRILDGATADAFLRAVQLQLEGWQTE